MFENQMQEFEGRTLARRRGPNKRGLIIGGFQLEACLAVQTTEKGVEIFPSEIRRVSGHLSGLLDEPCHDENAQQVDGRPSRPSCGASQAISRSIQISIEPRLRRAAL